MELPIKAYLTQPHYPITIVVIGAGGTGSVFLSALAKIAISLSKLKNIQLDVAVYDPDTVSDANIGRQLFAPSELGYNKAVTLVTKINRTYGLHWRAIPEKYGIRYKIEQNWLEDNMANIVISCIDNIDGRKQINTIINDLHKNDFRVNDDSYFKNLFWVDIGNTKNQGNIIIKSRQSPSIIDKYPNIKDEDDDTPSCSLAEALNKQDLFVNTFAANLAGKWIWELLRNIEVPYSALYFNLLTYNIKTIKYEQKVDRNKV